MDWEWKQEEDGSIEESGHKGSKGDTVFANPIHLLQNTKERGQTDYKMVMDPKRTLTMVSTEYI